jgi:hypothetical protein
MRRGESEPEQPSAGHSVIEIDYLGGDSARVAE